MARPLEHLWHLYRLKRYELAEEELSKALRGDSSDAEALALLALIHSATGRGVEAIKTAQDALALAPDYAWYYFILATVKLEQDELFDAIDQLHEAIRIDSSSAEYYRLLAHCYSITQLFDHAHWCILKALSLDPEDTASLLQYGIIKFNSEHLEEADVIFKYVLSRDPENAISHQYLGWIRLDEFSTQTAQEHFKLSLQKQPESQYAQSGLTQAHELERSQYAKLYLQVKRWVTEMDPLLKKPVAKLDNPDLQVLMNRDSKDYCEMPAPVTVTKKIQYEYNPFADRIEPQPEPDDEETGGMSPKTQMLVVKLFFILLASVLLLYFSGIFK